MTTTGEPPLPTARRSNRSKVPNQLAADTDEQLFATTFEPLYGPLVRRLTLVLGSEQDAEDVAQESYLRAYRARHQFQGDDPRGWLYTIGLRLAFNTLRGRRRWIAAIRRVEPPIAQVPSDPDLWNALLTLNQRARAALLLNAIDGYTEAEVAEIMGAPVGTVSSWLHRAKVALREDLSTD